MKTTLKKELPLIGIALLPFIYLAYIWNKLPQEVPIHWNMEGKIDGYGNKAMLILVPVLLPLLVYLIILVIPKIDPKNKLNQMGNKLKNIKVLLTIFMSVLALFIIYSAKSQSFTNPNYIILGLGVLFIILGNYFKTIKPNYFLGIRTPWTLESETVWRATHKLAGKMWFIGGGLLVLSSLILEKQPNLIVFLTVTGIITIIPIFYSFMKFNAEKKAT